MASNGEAEQPGGNNDQLVHRLPDDVLADVFGRLALRWLAVSRCVCKAWHAVIDTRRLLCIDLLPLSLRGIIIYFDKHIYWEFLSRPTTRKDHSIGSGNFEYSLTVDAWAEPIDHCNGLLLLRDETYETTREYVANPATGWAAPLPPCPYRRLVKKGNYYTNYLLFDPSVSAHYQVFSVPRTMELNLVATEKSEWPASTFIIRVFSSVSGRWEERSFSREGEPSEPTAVNLSFSEQPCAIWRGSLYIRCVTDTVMRLSLSTNKFWEIEPPVGNREELIQKPHLGRSEKGVYLASLCGFRLRVWILDESCDHMKWVLRHDNNLAPLLPTRKNNRHAHGSWILPDFNYCSAVLNHPLDDNEESLSRHKFEWNTTPPDENFEWNSDDGEDALDDEDMIKVGYPGYLDILGFHPYKEIVFFSQSMEIGLAYFLNTSRVQILGNLHPKNCDRFVNWTCEKEISISFPYTPCLIEMCSTHN